MPRAHRNADNRFCGAITSVTGQSTVFVNNRLWAVVGDKDDHCGEGDLIAVYGPPSVEIEGKFAICAVGDSAAPDREVCIDLHPPSISRPKGGSGDTFVYEGTTGGGTVS